ncbi:hypothetical protein AB1Y20_012095 [Prymnesium parvum]|uniref:Glycosyl hydrolase family 43 protein n=1 Tax=Prymnesium parvum TaxID=97485 RepID=A0AB34IR58_PRYPA
MLASLFMSLIGGIRAIHTVRAFHSGQEWRDTNGQPIDAHGGGFLRVGSVYYWYGSARNGLSPACCHDRGINLYTSSDLYNWNFSGRVLSAFNGSSTGNGLDLERPKVVRCSSTGKYVMWVRGTGEGNTPQLLAVATSDAPTGPFVFAGNRSDPFHTVNAGNPLLPEGYQYADATLFEDPRTGRAYVYWRTRVNPQNTGFRAMELTSDCLAVRPESDTQLFQTANREAPAVFYANDRFYLWTSGTRGWEPTTTHLYTADAPLGCFNCSGLNNSLGWLIGWQPPPIPEPGQPGNQKPDQPGEWAFGSQSTYILQNPLYKSGSSLAPFVYIADRWTPTNTTSFGTYVWLPLFIDPRNASRVRVVWCESWRLDNITSPFRE